MGLDLFEGLGLSLLLGFEFGLKFWGFGLGLSCIWVDLEVGV